MAYQLGDNWRRRAFLAGCRLVWCAGSRSSRRFYVPDTVRRTVCGRRVAALKEATECDVIIADCTNDRLIVLISARAGRTDERVPAI